LIRNHIFEGGAEVGFGVPHGQNLDHATTSSTSWRQSLVITAFLIFPSWDDLLLTLASTSAQLFGPTL